MKYLIGFLVALLVLIFGAGFVIDNFVSGDDFYDLYPHVDTTVQEDEKYSIYFYQDSDAYSLLLKDDMERFAEISAANGIEFYLVDMSDSSNSDFYAESEEGTLQSGTDYPVTPEQANEFGLDNFVIGGTPVYLYVEDGEVMQVGTGVQTSSAGNSYISVQDAMENVAEMNGFEYQAEYQTIGN